jgi:hypothetical protein
VLAEEGLGPEQADQTGAKVIGFLCRSGTKPEASWMTRSGEMITTAKIAGNQIGAPMK